MSVADDLGPQYTVVEHGLRHPDGRVESLGTVEEYRVWRAATTVRRGDLVYVSRQVTGRDYRFVGGFLAGLPVPKVKPRWSAHPGVPAHVEHATDWVADS
jgi:hypothetical protein